MDLGGFGGLIGAGVGGILGGAPGAAAGASVGGSIDTNSANAARADASNEWSAAQYASRYQTQVKDLMAAGLNPMLAYSQSPGSAPSAQQVTFQNPFSGAASAYQQGLSTEASVKNLEASAQHHLASADQAKKMVEQIDATVDEIKERTKKIPLEADQIKFVIQKLAEEAANIAQDTENKTWVRKQIVATIAKLKSETKLIDNQVAVEESLDNWGRTSKEVAPMAKFLLDLFRSVK
jgi:hypothetical protein